ncbi:MULTISPECIES: hypothetical protein [Paraburkholderia]|uniref:Uncharacterized protein n=1 Tax=Paraburkholderia madseniana TaxID=2599607 RepID=A0AAP5BIR0_9BURK|nr:MULTISPECIES: hypothetical protein [Paraburkholderia]MCX4149288.1 hypothetical protein [Paraburkholderia madseniana]MDN7152223.1 hypothetical protein [Paraburkholderia sp. WS6]MDQ6411105.1 hypothetical protein [Paraburkholderia madseniana]
MVLNVKKIDSTASAIAGYGYGKSIDGTASTSLTTQYQYLIIQYNGTTRYII